VRGNWQARLARPDERVRAYVFISGFSAPQDCPREDNPATLENDIS